MRKHGVGVMAYAVPAVLIILILCPLIMIFIRAFVSDGRIDIAAFFSVIVRSRNARMIANSILLGIAVVAMSTVIAFPLAYFLSKTPLSRFRFLDIIFMIPFMTPPYIASMGWILFMQKRGLLQQLIPAAAGSENAFFSFFGLAFVMSLHVFPFMMTILRNAMVNIPDSLDDAVAVLGARPFLRMRRIFIPLLSGNYAIGGASCMREDTLRIRDSINSWEAHRI